MRNYASADVAFGPGVSVLVGPNGQGKTNLVEALAYLSTLSSHRVATDAPLIREGADQAVIRAEVERADRSVVMEVEINQGRANRARINKSPVPKLRDILGILRTVVFAPEDLALVKGDPAERRRYLDDLLAQRQPRMAGVRADYERVLKQRNALLKSSGAVRGSDRSEMDRTLQVWDEQLAEQGSQIMSARAELISRLTSPAADAYSMLLGGGEGVKIEYAPSVSLDPGESPDAAAFRDAILAAVAARRREELDRGLTLVGPHRDEMSVVLLGRPVRGYASQGESWSAALALRLAAFDLLEEEGGAPLLILDDVFAELDARRRERLVERVMHAPQALVTAAVADDVPDALSPAWFDVVEGTVTQRA